MTFFNTIMAHGDTIIVAIVALILGWDKFKSGSNGLQKQITEGYKERNAQLEAKLSERESEYKLTIEKLTKAQNETNLEVAGLKATMIEKDKYIEKITQLNTDRNPETLKLLTEISESNKKIMQFMKLMHDDSKINMKHQTDILEGQVIREKRIDTASATATGSPMRTPAK